MEDGNASVISFNHYAYGAVAGWFYDTIAGLRIDLSKAPEDQLVVAPHPGGGLGWAEGSVETPYGRFACRWKVDGERLRVEAEVPAGAAARFNAPTGWAVEGGAPAGPLVSGRHTMVLSPASATL